VHRENLEVPVLPRRLLGADGYLGLDAVDGYAVTFDFTSQLMRIEESRGLTEARIFFSSSIDIPVQGTYGHLKAINCDVDGVPATAFIDSGAEVTIGNRRLSEALLALGGGHRDEGSVPITGVTGGYVEGRVTTIENIRLRSLTFSIPQIVIADLQIFNIWGLHETPALLIGMNYLNRFAQVTIDYGIKEFRFRLASLAMARHASQDSKRRRAAVARGPVSEFLSPRLIP
jgi:hypothetical protein